MVCLRGVPMRWSRMETASRDGRMVLGCRGKDMGVVYWRDRVPEWSIEGDRGYWALMVTGWGAERDEWHPEYWRELPGPPV